MTTTNSFTAQGPAAIGFYAKGSHQAGPFKLGAFAVGGYAGVYGATDDLSAQPSAVSLVGHAGVFGSSIGDFGVAGHSVTGYGVGGYTEDSAGVTGYGYSSTSVGVGGVSTYGIGVSGWSPNNYGVQGQSDSSSGVVGLAGAPAPPANIPTIAGVIGIAGALGPTIPNPDLPGDAAVMGSSDTAPGVIGTSRAQAGVYGFSKEGDGVVGHSTNYAGFFIGNLLVVNGIKAAAVPFPDGTHRVLYCMESPELWFEDFGTAKLRRGRAVVKLEADFAKVIKRGDYRVFPAPEGDCHGLYVRRKSANSFEVRELMGGKSNVTFSYRIVGRRKDIKGQHRFAKVDALRRVPPRQRAARSAPRVKIPQRVPARLRALATRMEKQAQAQTSKRARKRKRSAR
jgi:hypothetical protein